MFGQQTEDLFFNETATSEIYSLSLHDALPISLNGPRAGASRGRSSACRSGCATRAPCQRPCPGRGPSRARGRLPPRSTDRKSTRLNSSHANISYAVFCLKKKVNSLLPFILLPV